MAVITVRNLGDDVQRRLKQRAAAHNQSMEAEARAILSAAVADGNFVESWLAIAARYRGDDLALPSRSTTRTVDLS